MNEQRKVVVYIHNLSYDVGGYLKNYLISTNQTFRIMALKPHKILQIETDYFIFKCSWLLSNRSLDAWCKALETDYVKAVGSIDYDLIHYQDEELTENDWYYQLSDVASMSDCWFKECGEQFNIQNIPLTSTGFVRFDGRQLFRKDKENRKLFQEQSLDAETYDLATNCFYGGYTHGNRKFRGKKIKATKKNPIKHRDFRSFYPSASRCCYMPYGKFSMFYRYNANDPLSDELFETMLNNKCCMIQLLIRNGRLNPSVTAPMLSEHNIYNNRTSPIVDITSDNGRVLEFVGTTIQYFTELDWKLIRTQYHFDEVTVLSLATAERRPVPQWFATLTDTYFEKKNTLKLVNPLEYAKSKNKLNAIYGCSASRLYRDNFQMDLETGEWFIDNDNDLETGLNKYYASRSNFMSYQYGLYITAHCRSILIGEFIRDIVGYENFIYADTDSIFYISNKEIEKKIDDWNERNRLERLANGQGIFDNNNEFVEYMTFEDENDNISEFKFLHAKCYGMIANGELSITVAGVTRRSRDGKMTREDELGSLDNLENGFIFKECGGTYSEYVEQQPTVEIINGHRTEYASSCIIRDSEYQVNDVYKVWIEDVEETDL